MSFEKVNLLIYGKTSEESMAQLKKGWNLFLKKLNSSIENSYLT